VWCRCSCERRRGQRSGGGKHEGPWPARADRYSSATRSRSGKYCRAGFDGRGTPSACPRAAHRVRPTRDKVSVRSPRLDAAQGFDSPPLFFLFFYLLFFSPRQQIDRIETSCAPLADARARARDREQTATRANPGVCTGAREGRLESLAGVRTGVRSPSISCGRFPRDHLGLAPLEQRSHRYTGAERLTHLAASQKVGAPPTNPPPLGRRTCSTEVESERADPGVCRSRTRARAWGATRSTSSPTRREDMPEISLPVATTTRRGARNMLV